MRCRLAAFAVLCGLVVSLCSCTTPPSDQVRVNGRILLTYVGANGDQTDYGGTLGENAAHCITVGHDVVIAPHDARLLDDGSVIVAGHTWRPGTFVHVSGSRTPSAPPDSLCKAPPDGYWTTATTWN